VIELNKSQSNH